MQIIHHLINESRFKVITINLLLLFLMCIQRWRKKEIRVIFSLMETEYVSGFPMIVYSRYEQDLF